MRSYCYQPKFLTVCFPAAEFIARLVALPEDRKGVLNCAIGTIRYSCVDKVDPNDENDKDELYDGVLIYIKPSLITGEPRDILNYYQANPTFPEETIVDQWFSESQFESYRALGNHIVEIICKQDPEAESLEHFEFQARAHVNRNRELKSEQK